jgi:hypothetical protein
MWMLALGAGVTKGESETPVHHVDVAATAAELLDVRATGLAGNSFRKLIL